MGNAAAYDAAILAALPLVYFKLLETTGTTMNDSSGNSHNGTYSNVTLNQAGPPGMGAAASFNGTTSEGICTLAGPDGAWTAEAIVNANTATGIRNVFAWGNTAYSFQLRQDSGTVNAYQNNNVADINATLAAGVVINSWHHWATKWNGTDTLSLWIDGVKVNSVAMSAMRPNGNHLSIGYDGVDGNLFFWSGLLQRIALFGTALADATITAHANLFLAIGGVGLGEEGMSGIICG